MTSPAFPSQPTEARTITDYVDVLKRFWVIVVLSTALVTILNTGMALTKTKVYQASTDLMLTQRQSDAVLSGGLGNSSSDRVIATQLKVVEGNAVAAKVSDALSINSSQLPDIGASAVGATDIIRITVRHQDPILAAKVASSAADAYIELRRQNSITDLTEAAVEVQLRIDTLQKNLDTLDPTSTDDLVKSQRQTALSQIAALESQLNQLQLTAALRTGDAQVVAPALVPSTPVEPRPKRSAAMGFILGVMLGVAAVFLIDYMDRSIPDADALALLMPEAAVLANVPLRARPEGQGEEDGPPISITSPRSTTAEAYRSLRTSIMFMSLDEPVSTILVTSALPGEGKTTTAANLAVVLAQAGHRVVLVDADLRRPRQHKLFTKHREVGLSSVLLGTHSITEALQPVDEVPGLMVMPSGPIPPSPSELLSSAAASDLLAEIRNNHADFVILDSAPVLPVADASVLASRVDGIVFVVGAGTTDRKDVITGYERLQSVGGRPLGVVLNRVGLRKGYGYGKYGYGYGRYGYGRYGYRYGGRYGRGRYGYGYRYGKYDYGSDSDAHGDAKYGYASEAEFHAMEGDDSVSTPASRA